MAQAPKVNPVKNEVSRQAAENWLHWIKHWYPYLHMQTYFLPPLHFSRVSYIKESLFGQTVMIPQDPLGQAGSSPKDGPKSGNDAQRIVYDSDIRNDAALQRVLYCLHALAEKERNVMMVVSQLDFNNYLGKPSYAAAVDFPRPNTLQPKDRDGHFDVLIIHKLYGVMTLEIKSVGANFNHLHMSAEEEDAILGRKINEAVKQLNKAELVLKHLVSDMPDVCVTKTLVMPNVTISQFKRSINDVHKELCQCLGVPSVDEALKKCLLADQLSTNDKPWNVTPTILRYLSTWWKNLDTNSRPLTDAMYEELVARFCGPATTVEIHCVSPPRLEIRMLHEAVIVTGERMAKLVLFPDQVELLNSPPPRAFLTGPPGTGKTVVLTMQGLNWLQRGHVVHVVSTWTDSCAASIVIEHQLLETMKYRHTSSSVYRHQFDFQKDGEVQPAVERLKSTESLKERTLCVVADEAFSGPNFQQFCDELIQRVPGVHLWACSIFHGSRPLCLKEVRLTTPLRSPPSVIREVEDANAIQRGKVYPYSVSSTPVPTDGPGVKILVHNENNFGHTGKLPLKCKKCGHQLADFLEDFRVGELRDGKSPLRPLQYSDVMVLCYYNPTDSNCGLVQGLRERHVPVCVVEKENDAAVRDMALHTSNTVTVTNWHNVRGLERKVIVVDKYGSDDLFCRLNAISRCSSQLVLLENSNNIHVKFCGPATTVEIPFVSPPRLEIRMLPEAFIVTGERMAKLELFPDQVELLNSPPPRAFLTGPPGTGKTVVLTMQGLNWLQRGHVVHVVSTWTDSCAASIVIEHQLLETMKCRHTSSSVYRHQFDFQKDGEVQPAVERLKSTESLKERTLCVVADEAFSGPNFQQFCVELIQRIPGVHLWAGSIFHGSRPPCLQEVRLTKPLRSPPSVIREVEDADAIQRGKVYPYSVSSTPVPTDGPGVKILVHNENDFGHTGKLPLKCKKCGHQLADFLKELRVGELGDGKSPLRPLQYSDVMVLCYYKPTDSNCGLVQGLRERHVPVCVVEKENDTAVRDMALRTSNTVTVTNWHNVRGLERKVIVVDKYGSDDLFCRLNAISRCSSQLVLLENSNNIHGK